jgi:hypothetical protein
MADTRSTSRRETVETGPPESSGSAGTTEKAVAQGRSAGAPFVLLGGVALVVWAFVAVVAAVLLLVWWLG